jgi:L-rhamnonate dehydratase
MKIKEIRAFPSDITPRPTTKPRSAPVQDGAFVSPTWRYPELKGARGRTAHAVWKRVACVVTAEDGTWGLGMSILSGPVVRIIEDSIAPQLVGMDCMAIERVWDAMNRMTAAYSNGGLSSYAISAVDTALWDLKGKLLGRPVYELLGGPQKDRIPCYGSNTILSYGLEASLEWFLELGFRAVKVFMDAGPWDGIEGINRTEERVARAREIVGNDVELMLDCWMSLDVDYAARLIERLQPYRLKWVEDLLLPEDQEGYARLRRRSGNQSIATGEHWYTTHPFAKAAADGSVDIFQPDVLWVGGISGAVRICHIAEAFGLAVITHGGMNFPYGQHLAYATPAIPWGERSEGVAAPGVPLEEMTFLPGTPVIKDGFVVPSNAPGFGIDVTLDWLQQRAG